MLRNYIKIALRNLFKNKVFSLINILGLSIGMACCMLILLWVRHELSYDWHHERPEDIYRVATIFKGDEGENQTAGTPAPLGPLMKTEYPEITAVTRMFIPFNEDKSIFQLREEGRVETAFYESRGYMVDSRFFEIFQYDFIDGNPTTALNQPNTVVLPQSIAKKLFGDEPALGRTVRIGNSVGDIDYTITGIFADSEEPSHIDGRFFMSIYSGFIGEFITQVTNLANNNFLYTYVRLRPDANAQVLESKFPAFMKKYASEDLKAAGYWKDQSLQPVTDIHLHSDLDFDFGTRGNITYVYILALIALLTLLIACINFMNLSTARSGTRAAEVGIRKVMGAEKQSLIRQFIGESMLISLLSLLIAVVTVELFLPLFNNLTSKELSLLSEPTSLLWFVGIALITGLLAGSYPAFYLSSFNPTTVLKGKLANSLSATTLRRGLVIFQFVISICLIISTLFINRQMTYMQNQNLGFQEDQQIVIPLRTETAKRIAKIYKNNINQNTQTLSAASFTTPPGINPISDISFYRQGQNIQDSKSIRLNYVDQDYAQTLGLELVTGRFFSRDFPADTLNRVVLNESAIQELGFTSPEEAVGQPLFFDWRGEARRYELIGVVEDFHYVSLQNEIRPYGMMLFNAETAPPPNYLTVHTNTSQMSNFLGYLEDEWRAMNPNEPFEYSFLDEDFQRNYEAEQRIASTIWYFTLLAIFISCLGLFGLAAFTAERRIKEIGIRKVLGASVQNIVLLLSKEFVLLIVVAFAIAIPIAWYATSRWLETFAYRIDIGWWVFALAGILALVIALLTTSVQAIRAAVSNPIDSLRSE